MTIKLLKLLSPIELERCACCGREIEGRAVYNQGAFECAACASGVHRHARLAVAA
jgi:hypothetical protein